MAFGLPLVGILLLVASERSSKATVGEKEPVPREFGPNLKLVASYEPLHLYIYANTDSTNKLADFAVLERHELLFSRLNQPSNIIETSHYEEGLVVLTTWRDGNERVLKRYMDAYENREASSGKHEARSPQYVYMDSDGDGQWDRFVANSTKEIYARSNLCWVPLPKRPNSR